MEITFSEDRRDDSSSTLASRLRQLMIGVRNRFTSSSTVGAVNICRLAGWILNFLGLFTFFVSLCVLESKLNSNGTGLLWWTLLFHSAVCAIWLSRTFGKCAAIIPDINPLRCISATLLMVSCDRAIQLEAAQVRRPFSKQTFPTP